MMIDHSYEISGNEIPLSKFVKFLIVLSLLIFFLLIAFSSYTSIPVLISVRGYVMNEDEFGSIRSPIETSLKSIEVETGAHVKQGELLAVLDVSKEQSELEYIESRIKSNERFIEMANIIFALKNDDHTIHDLLSEYPESLEKQIILSDYESLKISLQLVEYKINENRNQSLKNKLRRDRILIEKDKTEEELASHRQLSIKGFINAYQVKEYEYNLKKIEIDLEELNLLLEFYIEGYGNLKNEKRKLINSFYKNLIAEINKKNSEVETLKQKQRTLEYIINRSSLYSPYTGYVKRAPTLVPGSGVFYGEELFYITSTSSRRILEVDIPNQDVAFVKIGQPVRVKLDAYEYERYGSISGQITYVSSDGYEKFNDIFFKAKISFEDESVLKEQYDINLINGMTAVADIKVKERKIIAYFIQPLIDSVSGILTER
ncbi:HlyD family efflux transporter periplasmic adaptor subunit [Vibrio vulnificus]